jgi:DegV family protein with EDD domain
MAKIIVDSGCDLTPEMKEDASISLVPITLIVDNVEFLDDQNLDIDNYLSKLENSSSVARSAAPSPEKFYEKFLEEDKTEGDSIFVVTCSSLGSATYSSAVLAKEMYMEKFGNKFIHIFDSLSASACETVIALKIKECLNNKLPNEEIVTTVSSLIPNLKTYFIFENFDVAVKNGRISPHVAKIASIFNISPICHSDKGKMALLDKARGHDKAIVKMIKTICKQEINFSERTLVITYVKSSEKAAEFKNKISSLVNFKDIIIVEAGGLCATYAGKKGLIVAF